MAKKTTIDMVAKRAGVSRGTVDRVINQRSYVKAEVKERVIQAIKDLDYMPLRTEQAHRLGLTDKTAETCKLGVLLPNWTGYFKSEVTRGIADAQKLLKDYHIDVLIEESQTDMPDEIVERLEFLRQQGVNGIAMCAKDHKSIIQSINSLHESGIPVVTFNSDIATSKRLCFIGQDLLQGGRVAGELMIKLLDSKDKLLVGVGNPEFYAHRGRLQGFCDRIYEEGFEEKNLKIIKTYNDYFLTYQKVSEALIEEPDIKGIYMANHSAIGCAEAVNESGLQGKIHIICHDLTNETKHLLKVGKIDFALAQNIYKQGYRPLIILKDFLQKNIMPDIVMEKSSIEIICAENIAE